jgi:hypothetical protein
VLVVPPLAVLGRFVVAWSAGERIPGSGPALIAIVMLAALGFTSLLLVAVAAGIHFLTVVSVRQLTAEFPEAIVVPVTSGADQVAQLRALGASDPLLARTRGLVAVIDSTSISLWKKGSWPRLLAHLTAADVRYDVGIYEYFGRRYRTLRATFAGGDTAGSLDLLALRFQALVPRMMPLEQLNQIVSKLATRRMEP